MPFLAILCDSLFLCYFIISILRHFIAVLRRFNIKQGILSTKIFTHDLEPIQAVKTLLLDIITQPQRTQPRTDSRSRAKATSGQLFKVCALPSVFYLVTVASFFGVCYHFPKVNCRRCVPLFPQSKLQVSF